MPLYEVVSTPNPDSLKFAADGFRFVETGMISAKSSDEAEGNVLAERLCETDGVANVFLLPEFMTVTKHPGASWDELLPIIEAMIEIHYSGRSDRRN